jgi:hypothetical protein
MEYVTNYYTDGKNPRIGVCICGLNLCLEACGLKLCGAHFCGINACGIN